MTFTEACQCAKIPAWKPLYPVKMVAQLLPYAKRTIAEKNIIPITVDSRGRKCVERHLLVDYFNKLNRKSQVFSLHDKEKI